MPNYFTNQFSRSMDTLIFDNYHDYYTYCLKYMCRVNGVSKEFAKQHPNFKEDNATNRGCWNCLNCTKCAGCVSCVNCHLCLCCIISLNCGKCRYCDNCNSCTGCWDCNSYSSLENERGKEKNFDANN